MLNVNRGWVIVGAAFLINMIISGFTISAFSLYVVPISSEFNLSRADANTALILVNVGTAGLAPFLGRLLDRVPVRWTMATCSTALGVALVILSQSRSLTLNIALLLVVVPAGYLGAGSLTNTVLIARWFQRQRGRAMALASLGMSLSTVGIVPLVGWAIQAEGWRNALAISGLASLSILLPVSFLVPGSPGPDEGETGADPREVSERGSHATRPASVLAIMKSADFWLICIGTALALAIAQTLVISMVPLALERGLTMLQASTLISATGIGAIAGAITLVALGNQANGALVLAALYVAIALLNVALLLGSSYPVLLGIAIAKGVATGCVLPVFYALLADRFGVASFGTVRGLSMPILAAVSMVFLRLSGEGYDRFGNYDLTFQVFAGAGLVAALLLAAAYQSPPKSSPRRSPPGESLY